ncbi:aspartate racemase [Methanocella sp. CWC-04]|uniref:Aspartate racemase n=1 Tax=Methanooceanicella nereidis TaxID=2052831 RepID=A0AAP2RFY1_9EURY|nr:aspartate/glutamate racemase family protein [Methanocella sp. CWC-04]MCD1295865.1 aspartate racemase [Methanocella sp. CWC-04]
MKTIGLIGGMSWESSIEYYRIINESVRDRLGGLHSAKCIMCSVDFEEIAKLQREGDWKELTEKMVGAARKLKTAGADFVIICTNTMHIMADDVRDQADIPLIHIADAAGQNIKEKGLKKVGLLGTKFTMEKDFYKKRLQENYGIEAIIPDENDREEVHRIIFEELCAGVIKRSSKARFKEVIAKLVSSGAEGVILGCTEIPLIIKQEDVNVPVFDTMTIHAVSAVDMALN